MTVVSNGPLLRHLEENGCIEFFTIDIDEHDPNSKKEDVTNKSKTRSTLRLYGITNDNKSVTCHIHGFLPYFYVSLDSGYEGIYGVEDRIVLKQSDVELCVETNRVRTDDIDLLCEAIIKTVSGKGDRRTPQEKPICQIEYFYKKNVYGYDGDNMRLLFKIYLSASYYMNSVKRMLEDGFSYNDNHIRFSSYESNVPFVIRFMGDIGLNGMSWVKIDRNDVACSYESITKKQSSSQIEFDVMWDKIKIHPFEGKYSKIAPLKILSFDIECSGRPGMFPVPTIDPIIQIATVVYIHNESIESKIVFTLNTCEDIPDVKIRSFDKESDMLISWANLFVTLDPDFVTGYNICNFDFPYLLDRAAYYNIDSYFHLGRIFAIKTKAVDIMSSSRAFGVRTSKYINLEGRVCFDMFNIIQKDHKLRSYSLNSVSSHFLNEQKEDVHHSIITDLQNGNDQTRRRLATYCLKDAVLPIKLMNKLMSIITYTELARVMGVPITYVLFKGQQIRIMSQLLRVATKDGYVIPHIKVTTSEEQYEGATVIEPIRGFYNIPIVTLDFASLYPSIMIAYNLCYTTYVKKKDISRLGLKEEDYIITPSGDCFVKKHIRKGILPNILEDLILERKKTKLQMKLTEDDNERDILDGRQNALKITTNAVYGFTGASVGFLPLIGISQSVTSFGRELIHEAKNLVEVTYTKTNGFDHDSKVIYGDTDSVMINFGVEDIGKAMQLGQEASVAISDSFPNHISMVFEKVYFPYLLINKKRYVGLYWTKTDTYDKVDSKGIETIRRDNCQLVQNVIKTCLDKILIERDIDLAKTYVKNIVSDLLQNKIDISQLVITKALSRTQYVGKQVHVSLVERMKERDSASAPNIGDRIPYVIIESGKDVPIHERSEDPIYVVEHDLPIDTNYYLEKQLMKPIMRIFEPILENPNELFVGEHTRIKKIFKSSSGMLRGFLSKVNTCKGCKHPLKSDEKVVCDYCKKNIKELYLDSLYEHKVLETRYSRLWTQCQRCQGSNHQDVICSNRDCDIFYMRKKAQKDMKDSYEVMNRFDYEW